MNKSIVVVGSGGHARSLLQLLANLNILVDGVYDPGFEGEEEILNAKLLGNLKAVPKSSLVISAAGNNETRKEQFEYFQRQIYPLNLIHPTAIVEDNSILGNSNQVLARAYIGSTARIGRGNLINTGAILEHEVQIGSFNHISVGTILCGRVKIGDECFIGAGSVIKETVEICDGVTVGANSTVLESIKIPGVYVGSPARCVK